MTDQTVDAGSKPDNSTADANKGQPDAAAIAAAASAAAKAGTADTGAADAAKAAADKAAADKTAADQAAANGGEKWRENYAVKKATVDGKLDQAAHDKLLNRLKRFPSIDDALESFFNADKKIADGTYRKPLGDKATPEEVAEYRKANGIPESHDKYLEKLPDGLVIGDEDKPFIEKFTKAFHDKNADPSVVAAAIKTYYEVVDEQEGLRAQANAAAKTATEDAMREEWGPDFRANTNLINSFVGSMPKDLQDELFQSSKPDGTQIMNNPAMLKWLAQQARELNYTGAVLPSGEASAKGLESEINTLKGLMGDRSSKYWKGPEAQALQSRYRELVDLQQKIAARNAA